MVCIDLRSDCCSLRIWLIFEFSVLNRRKGSDSFSLFPLDKLLFEDIIVVVIEKASEEQKGAARLEFNELFFIPLDRFQVAKISLQFALRSLLLTFELVRWLPNTGETRSGEAMLLGINLD